MQLAGAEGIGALALPATAGGLWPISGVSHVKPECGDGATPVSEPKFDTVDCLRRIKGGDENAVEELIRQIYPLVIKIVRRNLPRRDSEEDLAQEVLVKVISHLPDFRETAPFDHWVSRITVNTCLNRLRSQNARPEWRWADLPEAQSEALETVAAGKSPSPVECLSLKDLVDHILEELSPEDRVIIRLLEMEGMTVKEVCARTGWSGTMIRVRAFRARRKLNRKFAELWKRGEL